MTPDNKLAFVEPEMEVVLFDQSDVETALNSDDYFWGEGDIVDGVPEV